MTAASYPPVAIPIDPRISAVASGIVAAIPEAQVRLFGSRARGTDRPDSDVDLLITVPDAWLERHDRVRVLGDLWRRCSSQRQQYRSAVTTRAYEEGILM
jgi:tRNA nucleotidyltransferase (CCA-adding enzyme)